MNRASASSGTTYQITIPIIWVLQQWQDREDREKIYKEMMTKKFPNLLKTKRPEIQESQWIQAQETWKTTWKHIIIKLLKTSDKKINT